MKCAALGRCASVLWSRPVWGAWIEIDRLPALVKEVFRRAPYGARGLKSRGVRRCKPSGKSRPVWGAWIEIIFRVPSSDYFRVAPRMGRVD